MAWREAVAAVGIIIRNPNRIREIFLHRMPYSIKKTEIPPKKVPEPVCEVKVPIKILVFGNVK
jgi:hypothetical protein